MPSLDIATVQPSLQAHLVPLGAQSIINVKTIPNPWKQTPFSKNLRFYTSQFHVQRGKLLITAVATIETKYPAHKDNEQSYSLSFSRPPDDQNRVSNGEELEQEVDDREKLRRMRISKANRGNTPWNKGRKHSPETLKKIRERTKIAMQDPKVKMKLSNLGHAQNKETRMKIGEGVRMRWVRRRERKRVQEICHYKWQNLLAEAAKEGYTDQEELQWDSYSVLDQQYQLEWLESIEQRKAARGAKSNRRAPKSPEQKRKIAEAISAKWADPSYRERVCSGLAKYHGVPSGVERRRRKPREISEQPRKKNPVKKLPKEIDTEPQIVKPRRRRTPVYKDPLANSKLEMIKNIRAKRVAEESKKMDAVEQARLLISEAEKAAKVLEIAAMKSPIAQASLLESKKLIAEATELIESIEFRQITTEEDETNLLEPDSINGAHFLNGTQSLYFTTNQSVSVTQPDNFQEDKASLQLNGSRVHIPETNGAIKLMENHLQNGSKVHVKEEKVLALESGNVITKKWVRGRLIEVTEAA